MGMYTAAIVLAVINFVYIYAFCFDELSEEQLVLYSPVWFLSFIFGTYGLVTAKLMKEVDRGKYRNVREALVASSRSYGIFGPLRQLLFFPLFLLGFKSVFLLALTSALIWGGLLYLFFLLIFPLL